MGNEFLIGTIGGIIGIAIGSYLTHWLNLKYTKKRVFFEKKIEYAMRTSNRFEEQVEIFNSLLNQLTEIGFKTKKLKEIIRPSKISTIIIEMEGHRMFFKKHGEISKKILKYLERRDEFVSKFKKIHLTKTEEEFNKSFTGLNTLLDNMVSAEFDVEDYFKKEINRF